VYTLTGAGSSPLPSGEGSKIALGLGARYITKRHGREGGREERRRKKNVYWLQQNDSNAHTHTHMHAKYSERKQKYCGYLPTERRNITEDFFAAGAAFGDFDFGGISWRLFAERQQQKDGADKVSS
jgi:hypothetical protein